MAFCNQKTISLWVLSVAFSFFGNAQNDSLSKQVTKKNTANGFLIRNGFTPRYYAFPLGLTAYGFLAMKSEELRELDSSIKEGIWNDDKHRPLAIDNYLQYAPGLSVFALRAAGVPGRNGLRDEVMIYLVSNAVMAAIVNPLKITTHEQRPDGSGRNSFPSGHTATAFVGAEFLSQEYRANSIWYTIAGYSVATGVGFLRVYNNRHWMRDIAAGAGIGIISTKITYWFYPRVKKILFAH